MTTKPQYQGDWRRVRRYVLARDGYQCQLKLKGCKGLANTVDHVIEVADFGAWWDPSNCVAACKRCNSAKSANRTNRIRWQKPQPSRAW